MKTWFDQQGFGESSAKQMAATYVMIASKEVPEPIVPASNESKKIPTKPKTSKSQAAEKAEARTEVGDPAGAGRALPSGPTVHIDLQIHIPADATSEQIDHIFASMAKHLYPK